jgi:hypothetical protein
MVNGLAGQPGYWTVGEMVTKYLDRNTAAVGGDGVSSAGTQRNFINSRIARLRAQVPTRLTFSITTNSGNPMTVNETSVTLAGRGWVDVHTVIANADSVDLEWQTESTWRGDVELEGGENDLNLIAFDAEGSIVGTDTIVVTSTVGWASPEILALDPDGANIGSQITITGTEFHNGIDVYFGARRATTVDYDEDGPTPGSLSVVVPDGSGTVDVRVENTDGRESNTLPFTYPPPPPQFLRGDANGDGQVDISDARKIAVSLFLGQVLVCEDAADADDSESLNVTDIIYLLDHLYRNGPTLTAPYPNTGPDPAGDALDCEN